MNNMTDKEYRSLELVSYSSLSKLVDSPRAYKASQESDRKETSEMILGSVVDMLLTDKGRFDDSVHVMTATKPGSELMLKYCNTLAETGDSRRAYDASGFKISLDAVVKKFDKEGRAYFDALLAGQGKMIIDAEDMFTANQLVTQLTSNPFTKGYFISDSPDVELKFQVSVVWDAQYHPVEGGDPRVMRVKSMIDVVHIDHANGYITPIDLKTGGEGFMKSYWRFKRYLQASMYTDSLAFAAWDDPEGRMNHYQVTPLKFVYADTKLFHAPMIYGSTSLDIAAGREGVDYLEPFDASVKWEKQDENKGRNLLMIAPLGQIKRKGYQRLIAELDWHQRNDIWDYTYEDYQNMGERQINAFGVKL